LWGNEISTPARNPETRDVGQSKRTQGRTNELTEVDRGTPVRPLTDIP